MLVAAIKPFEQLIGKRSSIQLQAEHTGSAINATGRILLEVTSVGGCNRDTGFRTPGRAREVGDMVRTYWCTCWGYQNGQVTDS